MHLHWFNYSHTRLGSTYFECRCGARDVTVLDTAFTPHVDTNWLNAKIPYRAHRDPLRLGLATAAFIAILVSLVFAAKAMSEEPEISICTFNVQFLGLSATRDNAALARYLAPNDVVVIQEVIAPPTLVVSPDGTPLRADPEVAAFFDAMTKHGYVYWLSEEDTGPTKKIHSNAASTEWWATFFKPEKVQQAMDLPHGFLAEDRSANPDYDRVPYAFAFRSASGTQDFVLISVHLRPGQWGRDRARRQHELQAIVGWINQQTSKEQDYYILGDCNIADQNELKRIMPVGYGSLNQDCLPTNTNLNRPRPYDHVFYRLLYAAELRRQGLVIDDIVEDMVPYWQGSKAYPGKPYKHDAFRQTYSDHRPAKFIIRVPLQDHD